MCSHHCPEHVFAHEGFEEFLIARWLRIPRDREQGFHGMVNSKSTAT
jgi:hypothetical protein